MKHFCLFFSFIFSLLLISQEYVLSLESMYKTSKKIIIYPGEIISVYINNSDEEITGNVKEISSSHLTLDSVKIPLGDIRIIKTYHNRKLYKKVLLGATIVISGAVVVTGFILIFNAIHAGAPAVFYLLPTGLAFDIGGIQAISWASTRLFSKGTIHYVGEDWVIFVKKN
ncbi:MAG: hypothetical protein N2Z72_03105 [Bacteroidales bacterium]|nr:hypothetical protein [Bacteroidales bacterium]